MDKLIYVYNKCNPINRQITKQHTNNNGVDKVNNTSGVSVTNGIKRRVGIGRLIVGNPQITFF